MESIIKIGALLREKGWFISTAESCTGGNLGTLLSKYSGSSSFYKGSIICYSTSMKLNILEIEEQLIKKYSVVSREIVEIMAKQIKIKSGSDVAIATTGNLGPKKGESSAEIGTVYISILTPKNHITRKFFFEGDREKNLRDTIKNALELLVDTLCK